MMKRDISHITFLILVWFTIFYTYINIVCAARRASSQAKKARNTILLHGFQLLLSMLNYVRAILEQALFFLLPDMRSIILFASYIIIQILPRFISPLVYGLRDQTFRNYMRRYLMCKVKVDNK